MNKFGIFLILVSICIVGAVTFYVVKPLQGYYDKNDAQRKSDLAKIAQALEVYKASYGTYPDYDQQYYTITAHDQNFKWGDIWTPYISVLPKDPGFFKHYVYWVDREGGYRSYRLYASLDNPDPICGVEDCPHVPGKMLCGYNAKCNYGITSGNISP